MPARPAPAWWLHRGTLARLLWPVSVVYRLVMGLHRGLYAIGLRRVRHAGIPVIVVGNVVAGGTGKTPLTVAIVRHLRQSGRYVGVVSRGYGRRTDDCREVTSDARPADVGDEPLLIHRSTDVPVFVAPRRIDAVRAMRQAYPWTQVIVSDDGLQHWGLARDVEICVFDDRGIGNGWLLPAGPLREPWPRRCDLVLHTGARAAFAGMRATRALAPHAIARDGQQVPLASLRARRVIALAGIARPAAFFDMLHARGIAPVRCIALPDHADFSGWHRPPDPDALLLCTEKDAAKLWPLAPDALAVPLLLTPEPAFFAALDARLGPLSSPDGSQAA